MKNAINFLLVTTILLLIAACSSTKSKTFNEDTAMHQRIAVLPFQSKLILTEKQKQSLADHKVKEVEMAQGVDVQEAVESYLAGKNLRVKVQSGNMTNSKLRNAGYDLSKVHEKDYTSLCQLLGVDAVVAGYIETEKPMDEKLAMGLNVAKKLETSLIGTAFGSGVKTSTNRGTCRVSIFEGKNGDRLWSYSEEIEMGVGSTTQDIVNALMRKGARKFPY